MKTIKFSLPFKTEDYLHSMTEEIADQAAIKLITAKEDFSGKIESCNISFMDVENQESEIFQAGLSVGAHAHAYGEQKRKEDEKTFLNWLLEVQKEIEECCEECSEEDSEEVEKSETDKILIMYMPEKCSPNLEEEELSKEEVSKEELSEIEVSKEELSEIEVEEEELIPLNNFKENSEFINFDVYIDKLSTKESKDLLRKLLENFRK